MSEYFLDVEKEAAEYNKVLLERWHEALERSSNTLGKDKELAERLETPELFLSYLENQQQMSNAQWLAKMRTQIIPYIKAINSFSVLFLALLAAPATSVGFKIVWGVFFLSIQVCLQTEERCKNMLEIHKVLRQTLTKINRLSSKLHHGLEDDEDFKEALVEVYELVVKFWVEAIKHVRDTRMSKDPKEPWKTIRASLNCTVAEIEERYRIMKEVADDHAMEVPDGASNLPLRPAASTTREPKRRIFVLNIPENTQFQGRDELIERMHAHLSPKRRTSRLCCFTLYGLGGVGKTQAAAAYAYKYGSREILDAEYDAVLWINSENDAALRQSFVDIPFALKLDGVTGMTDPQRVRREVQNWFGETELNWLLVFDNVDCWDTITSCWPPGSSRGAIIITSRDWSLANKPASAGEELTKMGQSDSRTLFANLLGIFDQSDPDVTVAFDEILKLMDGLPLAIQQVASIITSYRFSLPKFLDLYRSNRHRMHQDRGASSYAFYKETLHSVWKFPSSEQEVAVQQLRHLLGVLSLMAPDNIPVNLLRQSIEGDGDLAEPRSIYGTEIMLQSSLLKLRSTAMIQQSSDTVSMHRLTQAAFLDFLDIAHRSEVFSAASILVHQAFPKQHRGDPLLTQWDVCSEYAPHARSLVEKWQELRRQDLVNAIPKELIQLLCNAAWYLREIHDFEGSLLFVDVGLDAMKQAGTSSAEWELLHAHLLNTRGVVLWNQYDYTESKDALERARDIRSRHMAKDNIELIGTKANLASLVAAEGHYEEAQELYRQAEQDHDESAEDAAAKRLASCRYAATQGRLHTELGNFSKAEDELKRSLGFLNAGEDNILYRRAIDYCFGNLRLAERDITDAKHHYGACLDGYPASVTGKDQIRSCGCYYKLGYIALLEGNVSFADEQLRKASVLASKIGSMGWQGRILTLQSDLLRKHPELAANRGDTPEKLSRRADAIRAALASQSAEEEGSGKEFHIYTPWQTR
ncbi:hypothetical protein BDV96DRAFT_694735 [Lophiotrema nucula]|uniref:Uncharacterized protein n=1 Tax=Lophiotrema nucula TaxID=690887 RepID=A0A6A5YEA5_9PLEO|nr:hypothetical protein BDV96DRAFT_694735 [Lophiotrema nucula]